MDHGHLISAIGALLDAPNPQIGATRACYLYVVPRLAKGSRDRSDPDQCRVPPGPRQEKTPPGRHRLIRRSSERVAGSCLSGFRPIRLQSPRVYLAIPCGRGDVNQIGNHAHNDILSFELAFDGNVLVTDPGTYVYTPLPDMRNRFRSTSMHNSLVIDGRDNDWREGREGLFLLRDRSSPKVIACQPTHFLGEHSGFGSPTGARCASRKMASTHATNMRLKAPNKSCFMSRHLSGLFHRFHPCRSYL